jgi:GNAT superfamily N-acetyltransferase
MQGESLAGKKPPPPARLWKKESFMFALRRYTSADQEAVERLHVLAIQQTGAYRGRGPWDDDVYAIEEVYLKNQGEFLIGECDGLLVAMGALKRTSPERAEIKRMRVQPEYQGRGYGQLILDALEARARVLGYRVLHLDTSIFQISAQKLYEKNGFREVGRDKYQQEVGKGTYQPLEVILYEKPLL